MRGLQSPSPCPDTWAFLSAWSCHRPPLQTLQVSSHECPSPAKSSKPGLSSAACLRKASRLQARSGSLAARCQRPLRSSVV